MSGVVKVTVKPAGSRAPALAKGLPVTLEFPGKTVQTVSVGDVKAALQAKFSRFNVHRQKISLEGEKAALADEKSVAEAAFDAGKGAPLAKTDSPEIVFTVKDLGPQISWQTVFLIEYLGPLLIHPLIYHLPKIFYRSNFEHSQLQKLVYGFVLAHFAKRELETLFVHRFSHATMPARNIFKNSSHYWFLSGFLLAGGVYGPWNSAPRVAGTIFDQKNWLVGWSALWAVAELVNLSAHITLRNLRPAGTKQRGIPHGGLFEYVSCPNYLAEVVAWAAITAMTASPFAGIFLAVSAGQMGLWAVKKHKAYKREFGTQYPRGRKAMIPFIF